MKPFSTAEMVVFGCILGGVDFISGLLDLTLIGAVPATMLQAFTTWGIEQLQKSHGATNLGKISAKRFGKYVVNLVPVIPTVVVIFIVSAIMHNREAAQRSS